MLVTLYRLVMPLAAALVIVGGASKALATSFPPPIGNVSGAELSRTFQHVDELRIDDRNFRLNIYKVRNSYFELFPNMPGFKEQEAKFAALLLQKDMHILVTDLLSYGDGVDERTLGNNFQRYGRLDAGVSKAAYAAFHEWFLAIWNDLGRKSLEVIETADLARALDRNGAKYDAYKKARDQDEFTRKGITLKQLKLIAKIADVCPNQTCEEPAPPELVIVRDEFVDYCKTRSPQKARTLCLAKGNRTFENLFPYNQEMSILKALQGIELSQSYGEQGRRSDEYERRRNIKKQAKQWASAADIRRRLFEGEFLRGYCREYSFQKRKKPTLDNLPIEQTRIQFQHMCAANSEDVSQCVENMMTQWMEEMPKILEQADGGLPLSFEEREEEDTRCRELGEKTYMSCFEHTTAIVRQSKRPADENIDDAAIAACVLEDLREKLM